MLFPSTEWSGVAFYEKIEPDKLGWTENWRIVAFYPIDLGSSASTEFDGEELMEMQDKAYEDNPELRNCYKGLIHSHHGLANGAYISSVDRAHLVKCANKSCYPSFVVAHDSTGSPWAFAISYQDQYGNVHVSDYEDAYIIIEMGDYKPENLFQECLESLEKQKKQALISKPVLYNNRYSRQTSMFGIYQQGDMYDDDIKDEVYQKLLKDYRKKQEHYDSLSWNDNNNDKAHYESVEAEKKLDDYCLEHNLFGEGDTNVV